MVREGEFTQSFIHFTRSCRYLRRYVARGGGAGAFGARDSTKNCLDGRLFPRNYELLMLHSMCRCRHYSQRTLSTESQPLGARWKLVLSEQHCVEL
ncbi:hypothetical protein EVAR_33001_1 [Eumeta japonica]|uniref:Uncharacterized protein n=1 Tax=Eumeta variegata TaxID=151549 RepID=A0A4C1VTW7_EUMVA|nr:hypothetical protein EVAR_33001_1 [Eumeta japonica]